MADKYLDESAGGANNGGSGNDAWQSWTSAVAGAVAGDDIWVRRTTNDVQGAHLLPAADGTAVAPIQYIGWPRPAIPNTTITAADLTNGSKIIDNVTGITPSRTQHTPRYITAPDGKQYMITAVLWEASVDGMAGGSEFTNGSALTNTTQTKKGRIWEFTDNLNTTGILQYVRDSATAWVNNDNLTDADGGDAEIDASGETAVGFLIDREYAGTTVTGTDGKFQIEADEDYDTRPAIAQAAYDADAIDPPLVDFNDGNFYMLFNSKDYNILKNIEFKDSTNTSGILYFNVAKGCEITGCLFKQTVENDKLLFIRQSSICFINRTIFEGSGVGTAQRAIEFQSSLNTSLKNSAIYNMGDSGLYFITGSRVHLENVNIGIEIANGDDDLLIGINSPGEVIGKDVSLGGTNGYIVTTPGYCFIENYQKVLGDHKTWFSGGEYISTAVVGETPNKKLSDTILKITPNLPGYEFSRDGWKMKPLETEAEMPAGTYTLKYWVYNDGMEYLTEDNVKLVVEYISSYNNPQMYAMAEVESTETSDSAGTYTGDLVIDGDMENDDAAWLDQGTPTTNERSNEQAHGGTYSRKIVVDGVGEGLRQNFTGINWDGELWKAVIWVYGDGINALNISVVGSTTLETASNVIYPVGWTRVVFYFTGDSDTTPFIYATSVGTSGTWYLDDITIEKWTADADDWNSLSATFTQATQGKMRAKILWSKYHATADYFIDTEGVIT